MECTAGLTLRAETPADADFLYRVYASTRADELGALGWSGLDLETFLRSQFRTQHQAYRAAHPAASFDLVLLDGEPAGRLYIDRRADTIHVIDISLLAEHRGCGTGTRLLEGLLDEARARGCRVTLDCLQGSRALALYDRLGFSLAVADEAYLHLVWDPAS